MVTSIVCRFVCNVQAHSDKQNHICAPGIIYRPSLVLYHPLQLDTDMIRVICGLDPDVELVQAVTRQSRWRDTRRPRFLTEQQRAQVEDHSDMEEARRQVDHARALYEEPQQPIFLNRVRQREKELKNTRQRLVRALRQQVREN